MTESAGVSNPAICHTSLLAALILGLPSLGHAQGKGRQCRIHRSTGIPEEFHSAGRRCRLRKLQPELWVSSIISVRGDGLLTTLSYLQFFDGQGQGCHGYAEVNCLSGTASLPVRLNASSDHE
jgi:hypothetical protein